MAQDAEVVNKEPGIEEFECVVRFVRKLIDDRVIWIRIALPQLVQLVVDRRAFEAQVPSCGVPQDYAKQVLDSDLAEMLAAVLCGQKETLAYMRSYRFTEGAERKHERARVGKQLDVVERYLVTAGLRRRFEAKKHSVRDTFADCDWQINRHTGAAASADSGKLGTSVTLRFLTQEGARFDRWDALPAGWPPGLASNAVAVSTCFDVDTDELDYLLFVLRRARAACGEAE